MDSTSRSELFWLICQTKIKYIKIPKNNILNIGYIYHFSDTLHESQLCVEGHITQENENIKREIKMGS